MLDSKQKASNTSPCLPNGLFKRIQCMLYFANNFQVNLRDFTFYFSMSIQVPCSL